MGSSAAMVLFAMSVMGALFMAVIAFVELWGYSQIEAALAISPIAILGVVVSPLVGRAADRVPPRAIAIPALLAMAGGLLWLATFPERPDYQAVVAPLVVLGIGIGAIFPATSVAAMGSISGQELGVGSGVVNMSRQVGFAIGVAVLVAVFTGTLAAGDPPRDAYAAGFRVAALCSVLALPFALTMRRRPAEVHAAAAA
jgi:MFS family permease